MVFVGVFVLGFIVLIFMGTVGFRLFFFTFLFIVVVVVGILVFWWLSSSVGSSGIVFDRAERMKYRFVFLG